LGKKKRTLILHPFLFAVFPVLFFFSHNLGGLELDEMYGPAAEWFGVSLVVWAGLTLVLRNARKAALILSLFVLLFSSFGRVTDLIRLAGFPHGLWGWGPAAVLYLALFAVGTRFIVRTESDLVNLTRILNVSAAFAVIFTGARIAAYEIKARGARAASLRALEEAARLDGRILSLEPPQVKRNIYYIILDAYGRSDILKELYDYNNSELIDYLKSKGFHIATRSRANYAYTLFSLAASLNFEYPRDRGGMLEGGDWIPLRDMVAYNDVTRLLRKAGYRSVVCEGRADEIGNADVRMRPWEEREFTTELLRTTAALPLTDLANRKRIKVLYPFEHLPDTAEMEGPLFVYAHIMAPHRPFVFAADGSDPGLYGHPGAPPTHEVSRTAGITRSEHIRLYREQIAYVDGLVAKTVEAILARSRIPPIIVLQGDHGPEAYRDPTRIDCSYLAERMSILNAYYLPDNTGQHVQGHIQPLLRRTMPAAGGQILLLAGQGDMENDRRDRRDRHR
jgi:hypothetical protein